MKSRFLVGLVFFCSALTAEANSPFKSCQNDSLPSDGEYIPTSLQAERNRLEASIQDWREDLRLAMRHKKLVCAAGTAEWVIYGTVVSKHFEGSNADIQYLKKELASNNVVLPNILRQMPLASNELDAYQGLQAKEQDVASCAMEVRSAIDTKLFLISVLQRVYKSQIDYHAAQMGYHKDFQESCVIRQKRIERDRALIEAGNRLLPWYDVLEKAN